MHVFVAYFDVSRNRDESFNKFLSPDPDPNPDHLRGGPSHGDNTSCVKNQVNRGTSFELCVLIDKQTDRETYPNALPSHK